MVYCAQIGIGVKNPKHFRQNLKFHEIMEVEIKMHIIDCFISTIILKRCCNEIESYQERFYGEGHKFFTNQKLESTVFELFIG